MPATKAQQKAVAKYMSANYDEFKLRAYKGTKERIKEHTEKTKESVNAFINRAISETIERDNRTEE